jgi:hypothetical protein
MKVNNRRLQPHRYARMAKGNAFAANLPWNACVRLDGKSGAMDERRHRLIIGINPAQRLTGFILERGKRAPLVNLPVLLCAGGGGNKQQSDSRRIKGLIHRFRSKLYSQSDYLKLVGVQL